MMIHEIKLLTRSELQDYIMKQKEEIALLKSTIHKFEYTLIPKKDLEVFKLANLRNREGFLLFELHDYVRNKYLQLNNKW